MARVIRRGQKLGAFVDDSLLDVEVDQQTRIVKGVKDATLQQRRKSFGERMFPNLPKPAQQGEDGHGYEDVVVKGPKPQNVQKAVVLGDELNQLSVLKREATLRKEAPWLHGHISREEADALLMKAAKDVPAQQVSGLFLVRSSTKKANGYIISLHSGSTTHHYLFKQVSGGYRLKGQVFPAKDIPELLNTFKEDDDVGLACLLTRYVDRNGVPQRILQSDA